MYVCLCKGVTDHDIRRAIREEGAGSFSEVRDQLLVGTQCGKCARIARSVVSETLDALEPGTDFYDASLATA